MLSSFLDASTVYHHTDENVEDERIDVYNHQLLDSVLISTSSPRFRCATLERSDQTIFQTLPSDQTIVQPQALWSDRSATQEIVRP